MDTSLQSLDQIRASALDMAVRFGPKVVVAILILCAGYMVGRWVGRGLERLVGAAAHRADDRGIALGRVH